MKVKIGPYRDRWISHVHDRHMDIKYGKFKWSDNEDWEDRAWERFEDALQWLYNHTINLILDKRSSQKIKVHIDNYDTWSMDHTLAHIVVPMLKQLKDTKHGSPFVDDEDVPESLRSTSAPPKENDYDIDANHHDRWDWVIDEMIWAFEQKCRDNWEGDYYKYEHVEPNEESEDFSESLGLKLIWEDPEGRKAHQERMSKGFRLFGKYYEALWD
jgi:hypothetical protein